MSLDPPDSRSTLVPAWELATPREAGPPLEVVEFFAPPPERHPTRSRHAFARRGRLSIVLFVLTAISVFASGVYLGAGLPQPVMGLLYYGQVWLPTSAMLYDGLVFCLCLMGILLAHEMGHFLQAARHRVPATWPFFIPFPVSPFGTMGAVILQDGGRADRRQMFDIAIAGPLAGLVLALPITWYGVSISSVETFPPDASSIQYGNPLLLDWIVEQIHGPFAAEQDVLLNAPLFAGWVGLFITGLNLLPVGQLDGGHILYMLIGRKAHYVAYAVIGLAIAWMMYTRRVEFALIVVLMILMGPAHPPTSNDRAPLGIARAILGWLTLSFVIVGFTPTPIMM